ncbi:MAG: hypothetical protein LRY36_01780, partial [Alphaproteobacteria bacterium]|nr:hypothetical protein [Alphaproteobacteria bacterium]
YIGKEITYTSDKLSYDGTTPVQMSINVGAGANQGTLQILDKQGRVVYEDTDIADSEGTRGFIWNGYEADGSKASAGEYTVKVSATDSEGNPVNTSASFVGIGKSVYSSGSTVAIEVNNTHVPISNISQVKTVEPAAEEENT